MTEGGEQRLGEPHDPGEREQQHNAHGHRAAEPDRPSALLLFLRQLADEDRDEYDVIDPENYFEKGEGEQRNQPVGCEKGVHAVNLIRLPLLRIRRESCIEPRGSASPTRSIGLVCIVIASSTSLYGQQVSAPATPAPVFQTEVIVTAERGENERQTLSVATAVLTRREIEARPGATLAEAIETLPGFHMVFATGAGFRPTTIARGFFGGGEAEYVKLLVDGIPVSDAESGLIDWRMIPAVAIERVEAVRGPSSALYGDASLGGVVQVFTSGTDARRGRIAADAGAFGHRFVSAAYRQPVRAFSIDLLTSHNRAAGYRARSAVRESTGSIAAHRRAGSSEWTARGSFDHSDRDEPGALTLAS